MRAPVSDFGVSRKKRCPAIRHDCRFTKRSRCSKWISDGVRPYDSRIGWSLTEPTEALIDFIISQGWEDIRMSRNEGFSASGIGGKGGSTTGTGTATKKGNSRKMVCPCCRLTVRATRDNLRILCVDCNEQLIYTE